MMNLHRMKKIAFTLIVVVTMWMPPCYAQNINAEVLSKKWNAYWIAVPGASFQGYGVYKFRKIVAFAEKPSSFIIHVSGDNRYKLFVNGELVCLGPARGDIFYWNFETVDIARFLAEGNNVITAIVWNFGDQRPMAQMTNRTGFIVKGNSSTEDILNTNKTWKCIRDESYEPLAPDLLHTYYVSGPGERIDFNKQRHDWQRSSFNDQSWDAAIELGAGIPKGVFDWSHGWMLVPRSIPPMTLRPDRFRAIRKTKNINFPREFSDQLATHELSMTVLPKKKVSILLDQRVLTNAYPVLTFSKGKNAMITIRYAEALYKIENTADWKGEAQKGNRDDIEGKRFVGVADQLISNGTDGQEFFSLGWRTYRYVQLDIETMDEALTVNDFYGLQTGYPFEMKATFNARNPELDKIMEVGWRTARLCAMETYMDCPYYEQLQYAGDTRIQALVSLFNAGDDRLMRNAITLLDHSRLAEGITLSRYPSGQHQEIPPFSLWWIGMIHDHWRYQNDTTFIKQMLPGTRNVLNWFTSYQGADGSLKNTPYWNFTDWARGPGWDRGVPPVGSDGSSSLMDLQLCWAYSLAAEMEHALGLQELATQYQSAAQKLKDTIRKKYWNSTKKLFADDVDQKLFSQHANTLAILTGTVSIQEASPLMEKTISDETLTKATIYFKYYLHQALNKAGQGDKYLDLLQDWRDQLTSGLTTWAETSDVNSARSDCHGWGASPNIEFFRIVLGIDSDSPGFKKIRFEPHVGKLTDVSGTMPHPDGVISAHYFIKEKKWHAEVTIPKNTSSMLI
jgi:alpha-L-rhamnosidase